MEEKEGKTNRFIWTIAIIVIIIILMFMFRGNKKETTGTPATTQEIADINTFDVGDNPDVEVDDFNSLQVSQTDISP